MYRKSGNEFQEEIYKYERDVKILEYCLDAYQSLQEKFAENLVIIIGKTGAGKSTTINFLNGVDFVYSKSQDTGNIEVSEKT